MRSKAGCMLLARPLDQKSRSTWKKKGGPLESRPKRSKTERPKFISWMPSLQLWSPEHPVLYRVILTAGEDRLEDEMGFRTIETRGTQILLNGQPIFLKGISVHAEAPYRTGRAFSEQDAETLLGWVHELGGNYVRLAHYPHSERMTRLADRMGILVWSEIPVYWACHFDDPVVLSKAQSQLSEMIRRDRDKASVILWSVANETPATPARTAFLTTLVRDVHTTGSQPPRHGGFAGAAPRATPKLSTTHLVMSWTCWEPMSTLAGTNIRPPTLITPNGTFAIKSRSS